jgi:hypothetical protein
VVLTLSVSVQPLWIKAIQERPLFLKEAMTETANLPRYPFRFQNRQGDLQFAVTRSGAIYVHAEPPDDDDEDDDYEESDMECPEVVAHRTQVALDKARIKALVGHGYRCTNGERLWSFSENLYEHYLWLESSPHHDAQWEKLAINVVKAYEIRICPCHRRLCDFGSTCYMCKLETAGGRAVKKRPELIGEMAVEIMDEGGDWKCESEGAAVCGVCYLRKTHQMMFAECGHLACGECCRSISSKNCPHCRGSVTALQKVMFSA